MKIYILQQKFVDFRGTFWLDITKSDNLEYITNLYLSYKNNGFPNDYRVVVSYYG